MHSTLKAETKRGVAMVDGKAGLAAEKDLVTKLVNDVKRVKSVKNQLTIEQLRSGTHGLPDR